MQCKKILIREDLWNIVNKTAIIPNLKTNANLYSKYLWQKDCALMTSALLVELSLLYLIGNPDDPAVVLKKIADQFKGEKNVDEQVSVEEKILFA